MDDKAERQSRRHAALELFDVLNADYHELPGISTARIAVIGRQSGCAT